MSDADQPGSDHPDLGQPDPGQPGSGQPGSGQPDSGQPDSGQRRSRSSFWRELPFLVVISLGLALLIKTFLIQAFYIPSASMENTLQGGNPTCSLCGASPGHPFDRVLVNKLVYDFRSPRRGEVVVFKGPPRWPDESNFTTPSNPIARVFHDISSAVGLAPSSDSDFVKRVIGIGGDTISCRRDVLRVDGHVLQEPFLYPGSHPCSGDNFNGKTVVVPKGDIFVMGDHRDFSDDSRINGSVPVKDVVGRAFIVIWPASDWKSLPIPSTFTQAGLDVTGSDAGLVIVAVLIVGLAVLGWLAVVRRRRRRGSTYAAGDG